MTLRYKLRTLLIVLALIPPILAVIAPPLIRWLTPKPPVALPVAKLTPGPPYFATYATGAADPSVAFNVVATLLAGTPNLRVSLDRQSGSLVVLGQAHSHKAVQAIIDGLQRRPHWRR